MQKPLSGRELPGLQRVGGDREVAPAGTERQAGTLHAGPC